MTNWAGHPEQVPMRSIGTRRRAAPLFLRWLLAIFIAAFSSSMSWAQEGGKLSGTVRDQATREGLPGVNVVISGTKLGSVSDIEGKFFILNVQPGEYAVTATLLGYQRVTQLKVIVNSNRTTTVDFELKQTTVDIGQEVVVTAERPDVQREKTSTSDIIRSDEVVSVAGMTDVTSVLTLSSDISDDHFRGGREGEENYILQGMGIINPLSNTSSFAPIMSAVEEVEVITSGFSAQHGNAQSGVVNITMKEGRADKWTARAEIRTRAPGLKHFGPSMWDVNANPYLTILNSPEKWSDTNSTTQVRNYNSIGNGFDGRYGKDSVTLGAIAYTLWAAQSKRDLGQRYDKEWDYSLDATAGGPLTPEMRAFLAIHSDNTMPILPTPEPNQKRQFMGNIVYDVGGGMAVRLSGALTSERAYTFRSSSTTGFYSWMWDRTLGTSRANTDNNQIGVRLTHALNNKTFYELKLNMLSTQMTSGAPVIDSSIYLGDYGKSMWIPYGSTPDNFYFGNVDATFRNEKSRTYSIDASVTSQVTSSQMLAAGIQSSVYAVDVNSVLSLKSSNGQRYEVYTAKPFEFGIYAQDKMEFEGMIANVGLRFDLYDPNVVYYADQYSPYRYVTSNGDSIIDKSRATKEESTTLMRVQPRLGISFPVSISTVFHVNYGSFVQRPPFSQTVYQQTPNVGFRDMILGNPRLQPQVTNSYDVGLMQGLGEGFTIDISGYYKDVRNLIQQAFYYDVQGFGYSTFVNRDYADIRGFRIGLARRKGMITGTLNYTYGVATGKNSTPFNDSPKFSENGTISYAPTTKDVLLDFDRTHNLVASIVFKTGDNWGPGIGETYPLENLSLSATAFARSGRPYTYDVQGSGELYNKRTPAEYNTNVKITKELTNIFGARTSAYVEVFNVFDQKIYSYNAVFGKTRSNTTGTIDDNRNLIRYEADPSSLTYYEDVNHLGFKVDQSFMIYGNSPRSCYLGLVFNF
jgi:outer membrane receptor protein involved in Fe transport